MRKKNIQIAGSDGAKRRYSAFLTDSPNWRNRIPIHLAVTLFSFLLLTGTIFGQFENFTYKRELSSAGEGWHKIILPDEIFSKTKADLSDVRILGLKADGELAEAPFIMRQLSEQISEKPIEFKLINQTRSEEGFFYTFEAPASAAINRIDLKFSETNFDWRVRLEGSQNQTEWFAVVDNYRILSIKNASTDYAFTTLNFPNAKFRFFRLFVPGEKNPRFESAKLTLRQATPGSVRIFSVKSFTASEDKKAQQTVVDVELAQIVPVSSLKINVGAHFDFYRPISIKYAVKNLNSAEPVFLNHSSNILSSLEPTGFNFPEVKTDRLRVIISNQDNQPLRVDSLEVSGIPYELTVRFSEPARYFLVYGNEKDQKPNYDIANFRDKIPTQILELQIGEETVSAGPTAARKPLIESPLWLWAVILTAVALLGWFSFKMLRNNA